MAARPRGKSTPLLLTVTAGALLAQALLAACSKGATGGPSGPATANAQPRIERVLPAETSLSVEVGQSVSFTVEGMDPEGSPLTVEFLLDGERVATASPYRLQIAAEGAHTVEARLSDGVHVVSHRWSITVTPDIRQPPSVSLTVAPDSGSAPLQTVIQVGGADPDGSVALYELDADGNGAYEVSSPQPVSLPRRFERPGSHRVRARVTDDEGLTGVLERVVRVVVNRPPRAALTVSPQEGPAPLSVRVLGDGSDPDGALARYELDADGDGSYEISRTSPIDTTLVFADYTRAYTLALRVTDASGATDVDRKTVQPQPDVDERASSLSQNQTDRLLSDGKAARRITVRVVASTGAPISGVEVDLASSRNGAGNGTVDRMNPERGRTNAAGLFEADFRTNSSSTLFGDAVVTARAAGELLDDTITIQFVTPVNTYMSSLACPFQPVHVVGSPHEPREAEITAVVRDVNGDPLADMFVELKTRDPQIWPVTPASGRSNSAGEFRAVVTSEQPNDNTYVDFYADGHKTSAVCVVSFIP